MRTNSLKYGLVTALLVFATAASCGGDDDSQGGGAAGGTQPVTTALLNALPEYEGATLVREWLANGGRTQVREYAVNEAPAPFADPFTSYYRSALVDAGWEERTDLEAAGAFSKDGHRIVIGRVGPQLREPPSDATLLSSTDPPSGSGFFYTLEATE